MAVGWCGESFEEVVPPVASLAAADGEFECGFALGVAEDGGAGEQPPAQRDQFAFGELAEPALQEDAQIVGGDGRWQAASVAQNNRQQRPLIPNWAPNSLMRFSMSARPL